MNYNSIDFRVTQLTEVFIDSLHSRVSKNVVRRMLTLYTGSNLTILFPHVDVQSCNLFGGFYFDDPCILILNQDSYNFPVGTIGKLLLSGAILMAKCRVKSAENQYKVLSNSQIALGIDNFSNLTGNVIYKCLATGIVIKGKSLNENYCQVTIGSESFEVEYNFFPALIGEKIIEQV